MSDKLCGTCKHFTRHANQVFKDMGNCDKISTGDSGPVKSRMAYTRCVGTYSVLDVKDDFGCALWEPRRTPADPSGD